MRIIHTHAPGTPEHVTSGTAAHIYKLHAPHMRRAPDGRDGRPSERAGTGQTGAGTGVDLRKTALVRALAQSRAQRGDNFNFGCAHIFFALALPPRFFSGLLLADCSFRMHAQDLCLQSARAFAQRARAIF